MLYWFAVWLVFQGSVSMLSCPLQLSCMLTSHPPCASSLSQHIVGRFDQFRVCIVLRHDDFKGSASVLIYRITFLCTLTSQPSSSCPYPILSLWTLVNLNCVLICSRFAILGWIQPDWTLPIATMILRVCLFVWCLNNFAKMCIEY